MYSTFNEGKSVVAKRFIRTLKNKIFNNNTVHRTIKMKPTDVTTASYAEYNENSNKRNPKFKVGDHVRICKYKKFFAKGYAPNWSEEVFVVNKIKNTVP